MKEKLNNQKDRHEPELAQMNKIINDKTATRSKKSRVRKETVEKPIPTEEEYARMTPMQQVPWKRKYPERFKKNPKKWTCEACNKSMAYDSRLRHLKSCKGPN